MHLNFFIQFRNRAHSFQLFFCPPPIHFGPPQVTGWYVFGLSVAQNSYMTLQVILHIFFKYYRFVRYLFRGGLYNNGR